MAQAQPKDRTSACLDLSRPCAPAAQPRANERIAHRTNGRIARGAVAAAFAGRNPQEGQVPPLVPAPVREVAAVAAQGALVAARRVRGGNAGRRRAPQSRRPQVERGRGGGPGQAQGREDFRAHLVASSAYRRSRVDAQIGRVAPEGVGHGGQPGFDHALGDAPPPRVEQRNCPVDGIGQENRHAVGQSDSQENAGGSGSVSVAIASQDVPVGEGGMDANDGAVGLPAAHYGVPRPAIGQCANAFWRNPSSRPRTGSADRVWGGERRVGGRPACALGPQLGPSPQRCPSPQCCPRPQRGPGPQPRERRLPPGHGRRSRGRRGRRPARTPLVHQVPLHQANP